MDLQEHIQGLRLHVLDMARMSQRSVDYSIKACALGSAELCCSVRDRTFEIDALRCEITETVEVLLTRSIPRDADFRFVFASERIGRALETLHQHAVEIAGQCLQLLEVGRRPAWAAIGAIGDTVNSLVRLCVVALFEEDKQHAQAALSAGRVERSFETTFCDWFRTLDPTARARAQCERAIVTHLSSMARATYDIADALEFWLEDNDNEPRSRIAKRRPALASEGIQAQGPGDCPLRPNAFIF